jgi:hypothetical protein
MGEISEAVQAAWDHRLAYAAGLPALAAAFVEALRGLGLAATYRTPRRILYDAPGSLRAISGAIATLEVSNWPSSAYGRVLLPRCTIEGDLAPALPRAWSGFTVRFSDHMPNRRPFYTFDPINGGSVAEAMACLRHHLTGEGEPPERTITWSYHGRRPETALYRYERWQAFEGKNPWVRY